MIDPRDMTEHERIDWYGANDDLGGPAKPLRASSACPICGVTAPHQHTVEDLNALRREVEFLESKLGAAQQPAEPTERAKFERWAEPILGDNPTWRESGDCELAWQSWRAALVHPPAPSAEPVAWRIRGTDTVTFQARVAETWRTVAFDVEPLYTRATEQAPGGEG